MDFERTSAVHGTEMGGEGKIRRRQPRDRRPEERSATADNAGGPEETQDTGGATYFPPRTAKRKQITNHSIAGEDVEAAGAAAAAACTRDEEEDIY